MFLNPVSDLQRRIITSVADISLCFTFFISQNLDGKSVYHKTKVTNIDSPFAAKLGEEPRKIQAICNVQLELLKSCLQRMRRDTVFRVLDLLTNLGKLE